MYIQDDDHKARQRNDLWPKIIAKRITYIQLKFEW